MKGNLFPSSLKNKMTAMEKFFKVYDKSMPLVFYGYGQNFLEVYENFLRKDIKPRAICDRDLKKIGTFHEEIPILSLHESLKIYPDANFFITARAYAHEIKAELKNKVDPQKIFFFDFEKEEDDFIEYMEQREPEINYIFENLEDKLSKKIFANILRGWATCDCLYFESAFSKGQYFCDDFVFPIKNEIFVDAGAFTGDTILDFLSWNSGKYQKIYAFEPNPACHSALVDLAGSYKNITLISRGAYHFNGFAHFESENGIANSCGKIVEDSERGIKIPVGRIDDFVKGKISFIKMDIEGAERWALKGAEGTIRAFEPLLAVCIYHSKEDLLHIPLSIIKMNLNYKYYIRHHSFYRGETVFYAVPDSRAR